MFMNKDLTGIFVFIRYCVDNDYPAPKFREADDWEELFLFMKQQTLAGIGFAGIEKIRREGIEIPRKLLLRWFGLTEKIRWQNKVVNERAVQLVRLLEKEGMIGCVLKGQGNAVMYPDPFLRSSGDIDVWLDCGRKEIMSFARKRFPSTDLRYHHVDFPVFQDVAVELHFIPSIMNNPVHLMRLRRWLDDRKEGQFANYVILPGGMGRIPVPTLEFNIVYQLSHLMHHFFDEGIGLRQMMDYYFLLKKYNGNRDRIAADLKHLGMYKFAGAVMYVMQEIFGLEKERMLVPLDAKRGKTLMEEILKGGNFGKYSGLTNHSTSTKYFLKIRRNLRFVHEYPAEALCEPFFRTWHFFWRQWHKFV